MEKLTPKQEKFVDYYIKTANATEAAKLAGYSAKTAYAIGNENLKKLEIQKAIDEKVEKMCNERIAESKEIMERLTEIIRGKATEEIVLQSKGEFKKIDRKVNVRDRLRAIELLGKMCGWFLERTELSFNQQPVILVDDVRE